MGSQPDVIFLVLDGLRKDRLSIFGHERETSPNLDAFAEEAIVFENAYTPGPWSLPAHTSMLTGLYPSEHGMMNVLSNESVVITDGRATLADALAADADYKMVALRVRSRSTDRESPYNDRSVADGVVADLESAEPRMSNGSK